ncbi:MAG: hypothetical protein WCK48_01020 [bacterium]
MSNKYGKYLLLLPVALGITGTLAMAVPALADTTTGTTSTTKHQNAMWIRGGRGPGIMGTVNSISGNTLTVTSNAPVASGTTATVYTVDATNAKITKNNTAGTIASILVGDTVSVKGTVTGTNVVATMIRDGVVPNNKGMMGKKDGTTPNIPMMKGNGQPIVGGTVSKITGSILTITNQSNITYSVDATNASIYKGKATTTISSIATGDRVIAQGTVNGTSVVATSVIDQGQPVTTTTGTTNSGQSPPAHTGFFGGIENFFGKLFGF